MATSLSTEGARSSKYFVRMVSEALSFEGVKTKPLEKAASACCTGCSPGAIGALRFKPASQMSL
jgi:hypothetical protein